MKRFAITTVGVFGIVLVALASQAKASITQVATPWATDGSQEYNLVPTNYYSGGYTGSAEPARAVGLQVDIMDYLYGAGNWKQVSDATSFNAVGTTVAAVAKFAGNTEAISWDTASPSSVNLLFQLIGNFIQLGQDTTSFAPGGSFYLQDNSPAGSGTTWYSYNTNASTQNTDGGVHAVIFEITGTTGGKHNVTGDYVVAFEDEPTNPSYGPNASGNGDEDYNDAVVELSGVTGTPAVTGTPEPASLVVWSLLGGLGLAVGTWRRRKAS